MTTIIDARDSHKVPTHMTREAYESLGYEPVERYVVRNVCERGSCVEILAVAGMYVPCAHKICGDNRELILCPPYKTLAGARKWVARCYDYVIKM